MSEFRPSRYIQHSGYATVKTYEPIVATLTIPDSVTVDASADVVYSVPITLPTTNGIAWRAVVSSDKYSNGVITPSFLIPCKATEMGSEYDTFVYGEVLRSSSVSAELRVVFATAHLDTIVYSDCGQTLTIKLQPYLSPFDA